MTDETTREYWIIDWLQRQSPAEWHGYVERHEWDGGSTAPLEWIIARPDCDAGTAATIFWLLEPDYYLDGSHDDDQYAKLGFAIIARWEGAGFPKGRFSCDDGRPQGIEKINAGPHKVPASLADLIKGAEEYTLFDRLPPEINIAWHRANGREPPAYLLELQSLPKRVSDRPGSVTQDEAKAIWAQLGPTSAFPPLPPAAPPTTQSLLGRLKRWLGRKA